MRYFYLLCTCLPFMQLFSYENINRIRPQGTNSQNTSTIDEEYLEMISGNRAFKSLRMPAFRNKPRLGVQITGGQTDQQKALNRSEYDRNFMFYKEFMLMKQMDSVFDNLDVKKLSKPSQSITISGATGSSLPPEDRRTYYSMIAQKRLSHLSAFICTDAVAAKYFCPAGVCRPGTRPMGDWGGAGSQVNEFDKHEAYLGFIKEDLHLAMRKWWNEVDRGAYLVYPVQLMEYDMEKGGFPIRFSLQPINGINYSSAPGSENADKKLNNNFKTAIESIFVLDQDKARALRKSMIERKENKVFTVIQIRFHDKNNFKSGSSGFSSENPAYYIKIPVAEIFEDEGLTRKIGEIKLK